MRKNKKAYHWGGPLYDQGKEMNFEGFPRRLRSSKMQGIKRPKAGLIKIPRKGNGIVSDTICSRGRERQVKNLEKAHYPQGEGSQNKTVGKKGGRQKINQKKEERRKGLSWSWSTF